MELLIVNLISAISITIVMEIKKGIQSFGLRSFSPFGFIYFLPPFLAEANSLDEIFLSYSYSSVYYCFYSENWHAT